MAPASFMLCYIGPGGMLSAIGAFVALLGAALFAVLGFVWYPLKRLLRSLRKQPPENSDGLSATNGKPRSVEP
ncbi:MAG: hypothetical protein IT456_16880 [Planctomycetes bacterium]|jgi:hypothetical protein|nr:hypothetical protein [Planctomycetota bacterium]